MNNIIRTGQTVQPTLPAQADNDAQVISMWLHGRSPHTARAYDADTQAFLTFVAKPLRQVTLVDIQAFADSLAQRAPSGQARVLSAVKSLLSFAHKIGYSQFNVGGALRLPKQKNTLAERILPETAVLAMIGLEPNRRNKLLLRMLYASGGRVSEVCALKWRDAQQRDNGEGQVTLYGKGGTTRAVKLSAETWSELEGSRGDADLDEPIFPSRKGGGHLDPSQVKRIVAAAAGRAGLSHNVSPHWLRHSHASHALDRGCPIHLVQATLGHASVATTGRYLHARPEDSSAKYLGV